MSRATTIGERPWLQPEWSLTMSTGEERPATEAGQAAPDAELVSAARHGSREAFDLLVVRHRRGVYHICRRFAGNHEEAADLAQDAFLRAYRGLSRFKGDAAFKTWLYRIAVNVCLNRVTAKEPRLDRMEPLAAVERPDATAADAAASLLREERAREVRAAIAQLPPKQRATVILRVYQDLTHEEIARVLGSSAGACKANLFHALNRLRTLLRP